LTINDLGAPGARKPLTANDLRLFSIKMHLVFAIHPKTPYIVYMITVRKKSNFTKWYQVISFGTLVDEVSSRAEALKIASREAKTNKKSHINFLGKMVDRIKKN